MNNVEKLDIIPVKLSVIENIKYKYDCKISVSIKQVKKPEHPLREIISTAPLLVETSINKLQYHLTDHHQSKIFIQNGVMHQIIY